MNSLLVIISLVSLISSSTITVESAEYSALCSKPTKTQFNLLYKVDTPLASSLGEFEIQMSLEEEGKEPISTKCVQDESKEGIFVCEFTPTEDGKYHPKISEALVIGDNTIEAFDLSGYSVGFSSKDHILPAKEVYNITGYVSGSLIIYAQMEFSAELKNDTLPTVIIDGNKLSCSVYFKDSKFINCNIDIYSTFKERNKTYYGQINNVCGMKDAEVSLILFNKGPEFQILIQKFQEHVEEEYSCYNIKKDKDIELFYYPFGNGTLDPGETFNIDKIKYVDSQNTSNVIDTICTITSPYLFCKAQSDVKVAGTYNAYLAEDIKVERDKADFTIKAFNTSNQINANPDFVPLAINKTIEVSHDYKTAAEGQINFDFAEKATKPVVVKVNEKELECSIMDEKTEICKFTKEKLPVIKPDSKEYSGYILNACEKAELDVLVEVKDSNPLKIQLKNTSFTEKTFVWNTKNLFNFTLNFEVDDEFSRAIVLDELILKEENGNTTKKLTCDNNVDKKFFTCNIQPDFEGTFKIVLEEDYTGEFYSISKWSSEETITFAKDYTKPKEKEINVSHDYKKEKTGKFNIEFNDIIGDYNPEIKFSEINLNCTKNNTILECPITEDKFPAAKENDKKYEGNVINPAKISDAKITLTIAKNEKSGAKFMNVKVIFMLIGFILLA